MERQIADLLVEMHRRELWDAAAAERLARAARQSRSAATGAQGTCRASVRSLLLSLFHRPARAPRLEGPVGR